VGLCLLVNSHRRFEQSAVPSKRRTLVASHSVTVYKLQSLGFISSTRNCFPYSELSLIIVRSLNKIYPHVNGVNRIPLIRTLVIWNSNYPDRLGPSGKFVENSTKLTFLEITGYRIKYSPLLWLLEFPTRRGRKV